MTARNKYRTLIFTIPGKPCAKQRPRHSGSATYTPKPTVIYENHVKACFMVEYPMHTPVHCDIQLDVTAYWPIPKKKKAYYSETTRRNISPDWDNVGKIISDALNNIAYVDDKQITDCVVRKRYSDRPRVDVIITELVGNGGIGEL